MKSETMRTSTGRFSLSLLAAVGALLGAGNVQADTNIVTTDSGWEIFTAGRVNSFLNYFSGQGIPNNAEGVPTGGMLTQDSPTVHTVVGGGGVSSAQNSTARDEGKVRTGAGICPPGYDCQTVPQGTANGFRIRSGFLANVFGFGVRKALTPTTKFTAYIESWAQIESDGRRKYVPVPSDVRQGFIKIEGGWGSFLAGRALTLFSRGATVVDFLYAHQYGLGHPGNIDGYGPTAGHIGTGVMAAGFASGFVYATPSFGGLQLNLGIYDPVALTGAWERTKYPRPEGEITFDKNFGAGKIHLFANGGWQIFYQNGQPDSRSADPTPDPSPEVLYNETAYGGSVGGRFEFGPVRLGGSYYQGKGVGLTYAFENSPANFDNINDCSSLNPATMMPYDPSASAGLCAPGQVDDKRYQLRHSRGFHVQGVLSLAGGKLDLSAGFSQSQLLLLPGDRSLVDHDRDDQLTITTANPAGTPGADGLNDAAQMADPASTTAATGLVNPNSNIKTSTGISVVIVYHVSDSLHLALDYFHARYKWTQNESQLFNFVSAGMTVTW